MSTFSATPTEQKRAEKIRSQYIKKGESKTELLQKLDDKVKTPGKVTAYALGIIGALVMGFGMALVMVWQNMSLGLLFGIPGMVLILLVYPLYLFITNGRKKKYADEIMRLSNEIIGG